MNRYVVMVDAGYLLRQAVEIVSSRASTLRTDLSISNPAGLIRVLLEKSSATLDLTDKELLRVYWYDGVMANGLTPQQRSLADVDDVQFRAGTINDQGQQKGVDSLIVADLIELASHHAICDAVLVTGDSDLAVGMDVAQKRGVRIAVLGAQDRAVGVAHKQSFEITSRADRVGVLGPAEFSQVLRYIPAQQAPAQQIEAAVKAFIAQPPVPLAGVVDHSAKRIDAHVDRLLIHHVYTELGHGYLTETEKVYARQVFRAEVV